MKEVRLAYGREGLVVSVPDDAGKSLAVKLIAKMDEKGVVLASAEGAGVEEINVLIYMNS